METACVELEEAESTLTGCLEYTTRVAGTSPVAAFKAQESTELAILQRDALQHPSRRHRKATKPYERHKSVQGDSSAPSLSGDHAGKKIAAEGEATGAAPKVNAKARVKAFAPVPSYRV